MDCQRNTMMDGTSGLIPMIPIQRHPVGVNGEGLTIRADVEARLGWDFGPIAAEDLL